MNIKLPTPAEMPARLFDLMVQRFQLELVNGFAATDTALNLWFTEKLEGRTILRASFTFDYDMAVEGEHLPKVMGLMLQTVRNAGWFAVVHNATLDISEIDFSELQEEDEEDESEIDEDDDAGLVLRLDNDGEVETDSANISDVDDEDDEQVGIKDDAELELEFEDDDEDEEEEEESENDSEEEESEPVPRETRPLVDAISKFGDAIADGPVEWLDIVELDGTTVVLEIMRDGNELEIEVAAKFDEASEFRDVVYHVTPSNKPTLHFASLSALLTYLKEVYGDASKP